MEEERNAMPSGGIEPPAQGQTNFQVELLRTVSTAHNGWVQNERREEISSHYNLLNAASNIAN
jgi:hypothetical protein